MNQKSHKRSPLAGRAIAAAAALLLGGGGLIAINVSANAGQDPGGGSSTGQPAANASTIACPEVVDQIPDVPQQSRKEVDRNLALLDTQIGDSYQSLVSNRAKAASDPDWAQKSVLDPLADKRRTVIKNINTALEAEDAQPKGLEELAECQLKENDAAGGDGQTLEGEGQDAGQDGGQDAGQDGGQDAGQDGGQDAGQDGGQDAGQDAGQGEGDQQVGGPSPDDFVDITTVEPNAEGQDQGQNGGSNGTFTSDCGVNENKKFNSDNVIAAPGVSNGAKHMHDYIGNQDNTAFSSNDSLAAGETTCQNQEDQSTYYWPVLRLQNGQDEQDANAPGGGQDDNIGQIQQPASVTNEFQGSASGDVVEMPRFLRIITGDAKAFTNGDANANASWSCSGFEDRQLTDKYPICPEGSQVLRKFEFQSCWDGQNIDSANHRTHVDFANEDGSCDNGFQAIPKLVQTIAYDVPPGPGFAVDSFPEQLHKPITDHGDFINVFSEGLMKEAVDCINGGQQCNN
ncbi:DUF1996 domain-containing protein [Streptomyces sp. NPDC004647]|uniref:DUF1996 domain-containing protein n=1 Tax=Streptomyces sp. NPDC004647 TaxID=3154671 RepID=UPI0033AD9145